MAEPSSIHLSDYSLVGKDSARAIERGLAEADWYQSPVPKQELRRLLERRNGPAVRDTIIWFALLFGFGAWAAAWWGSGWCVLPFMLYGIVYASSSDSRWHEAGHGTAFRTDWLNNALYELASFMVLRESVPWRWSHTRHHSDTIIVGRDPEIAVPRPPNLTALFLNFFNILSFGRYFRNVCLHCVGRMNAEESTYIPEDEYPKVFLRARIYLAVYLGVIALSAYLRSLLPLMFIGLPNLYGAWMVSVYGFTQHAGLAEDVLDHRLNCRTVYMNFVHRYLYWNMNYHLEHHMFPLVPYHALPRLHALVKEDCPPTYDGLAGAYREIIPAVLRQVRDPGYYVRRPLPPAARRTEDSSGAIVGRAAADADGWTDVCPADRLRDEDVVRFDCGNRSYAVYRTADGQHYATDGFCTHGNAHLADGFVKGRLIECPKHNGRFDLTDGSPRRDPVCVALRTYPVEVAGGRVRIRLGAAGGAGAVESTPVYTFTVVSNENVATYIKELVLQAEPTSPRLAYRAGEYLQFIIPAYEKVRFSQMSVREPFAGVWRAHHVFDLEAQNPEEIRRNYSLATHPAGDGALRFNVRISTPPRGQACNPGRGSSYLFSLKPGDRVRAVGPFGDFHVKDTENEMVYIGGGAGMAPLRSHLSHLFETLATRRTVSFWYGARSLQELFYADYFNDLARRFPNFTFHVALSEPEPGDRWTSHTGFIHQVLFEHYLKAHPHPARPEYYLCGPPGLIKATRQTLKALNVPAGHIAYDEFN